MAKIGIIDSGVGGLSVFGEIFRLLPFEDYIYFSDNANCPYGEKEPEFITRRCTEIVSGMISEGVQAVVLACNTATSAAIASLRESFDIPFVGMEPAVKPAAQGTKSGVVGVLATKGTLSGAKYLGIKELYGSCVEIVENPGEGFVELVESGELEGQKAEKTVERSLRPLLDRGADIIVLGCTHYPFLLPVLRKIAGPGVTFVDPAPSVARRLVSVLETAGIRTASACGDLSDGGVVAGSRDYRASGPTDILDRMKW